MFLAVLLLLLGIVLFIGTFFVGAFIAANVDPWAWYAFPVAYIPSGIIAIISVACIIHSVTLFSGN